MTPRRFFTAAGVVAVAGVAGAISYRHQQHLAVTHGQTYALSLIWPLCVDGLVTVTAIAMSTDRADGYRPRPWALVGFWIGVLVSVTTNWLATDGGTINHCVSAFPALAFLLAIESLSSKPRTRKAPKVAAPAEVVPVPVAAEPEPMPVRAAPKPRAARSDSNAVKVAKTAARNPALTPVQIAARLELSEATVRRHLSTDNAATASSQVRIVNQTGNNTLVPSAGQVINGYDVLTGVSS